MRLKHTAAQLADLLCATGRPRRWLGQHFLIDEAVLDSISRLASLGTDVGLRQILEIGPGAGALTSLLLALGHRVTAIEIDGLACSHLERVFASQIATCSLELIEGDGLRETWPEGITDVVANIPYQISSPLIEKLRQQSVSTCVLMLQEEFARRLVGQDGPSSRGPLWISASLEWHTRLADRVPPSAFRPQPRVNSRLVLMQARDLLSDEEVQLDLAGFGGGPPSPRTIRAISASAFAQRRKKMRNSLARLPEKLNGRPGWSQTIWEDALQQAFSTEKTVFADLRPEALDLQDWLRLACSIEHARNR